MSKLQIVTTGKSCPASWGEMTGTDEVRHCALCHLDVYNLSAMTLPEAQALIDRREGRLCVKVFRRQDGTVITRDCEPLRADPPRPCVPRPAASAAPPSLSPSMSAMPDPPSDPPDGGTTSDPAPEEWMGVMVEPPELPLLLEPDDPRVPADTMLAEIGRAIRAAFAEPLACEAMLRDLEATLAERRDRRPFKCASCSGPFAVAAVVAPFDAVRSRERRERLCAQLQPVLASAFGARAEHLLHELRRAPAPAMGELRCDCGVLVEAPNEGPVPVIE